MSGRIKHQDIFVALAQTGLTQHFEYRSVIEYDSSRRLEQFVEIIAAKAAAAEREECALVAENEWNFDSTECGIDVANDIAAAIRARGKE
jgi:hypothetical protein